MWSLIRLILFPLKWAIKILAPLSLLLVAGLVAYLFFWLPDVSLLARHRPETTAFIERTREEFQRESHHKTIRQKWVRLDEISPALIEAVLIAEDDRFYLHQGFDFTEILNSMEANMKENRYVRGGSTLSQQLVKNLYLSPEKTYMRKINEALLTWKLEHSLSKDRILELYLNVAMWGDGIFGVEEASRYYFKKSASDLTEREAVSLAARLPNPLEKGSRPLQRRKAREKVILERLKKRPSRYRGTKRTLLVKQSEKDAKKKKKSTLLDPSSLNRLGNLAQKQIDHWWGNFTEDLEPDWKIPTQQATVSATKKTPKQPPTTERVSEQGKRKPMERKSPPEGVLREPVPRAQTARANPIPVQAPKVSGRLNPEITPAREPLRSVSASSKKKSRRSRDFRERLARLEKLLSDKD